MKDFDGINSERELCQVTVPFQSEQEEIEALQNRIQRLLSNPELSTELKEEFLQNNHIQLFTKYFGEISTGRIR